jgi:multisubunit Na+/H+ antiporter MnhE subunit
MRPRAAGALSAVLLWLAWWAAMFAFYLALVDTRQHPELVLGSIVAAAGASAAVAIRSARSLRASLAPGLLRLLPAAIWSLVSQSVLVLGFLVGRLAGRGRPASFRTAPFRGGGDGPRDVGRRALSEGLGSLGPNTIVIGIDRERDLIVVHQLARRDDQLDPLGLG